ncbi:WYL domain-containing protein [Actinotalea ferrariae]|uniref:helix-turn-helix transcriptional regulator n=1 Tax=Actinotalea ferrariae TaxID=1386098 RepID=UPI001C8CD7C0|nr:WYL domain-containing protein [Actinotalea ferrariae]MBX9243641.1 WYL domain-containing protein [Actinotalea ferrariae]
MLETSARLLALLGLLQSRPTWTGPELAERLGVTGRTIRTDIDRLRSLGYPVDATRGRTGAYRLGAGGRLPPLLLDDDEAVAVAVGLRAATGVAGIEDASQRASTKLQKVLPARLRGRVEALTASTGRAPENTGTNAPDPEVEPALLAEVAEAVHRHELLRLDHREEPMLVEPYRLVSWQRRWYLVARDPATGRWLALRVDWMRLRMRTGRRFTPTPLAEPEYADLVVREVASSGWAVHARILVPAPAAEVLARINPAVGVVEPVDDASCVLVTGADSVETIAAYIGMLGLPFRVDGPPELVEALRVLGERYAAAVR